MVPGDFAFYLRGTAHYSLLGLFLFSSLPDPRVSPLLRGCRARVRAGPLISWFKDMLILVYLPIISS